MKTLLIGALALFALPAAWTAEKDSCLECHSVLDGALQEPATRFADDIHQHEGFTCAACHGGDPSTDDMEQSMNPAKGYIGKPSRTAVPRLCAKCHSDPNLMHRYNPQQRVDQYEQYQTSVHGKRIAAGDTNVANCIDCHSVHNIRSVKDPQSPVYPSKVPATCARCHADPKHMAGYNIPTSQYADYQTSVHWQALSQRQDLSAPNCATCHGNHGATPPQVSSVALVCGTCHALEENLYENSPHQAAFDAMGVAGCVTCHSNHAIHMPSPAMLSGDKAVCSQCHEADTAGGKAAAAMYERLEGLTAALDRSKAILNQARIAGMEVSEPELKLQDAQAMLVKAKVSVHAFQPDAMAESVKEGQAGAQETYAAGQAALAELNYRREGLAVSLGAIFLTILGLWLSIRAIESRQAAAKQQGR